MPTVTAWLAGLRVGLAVPAGTVSSFSTLRSRCWFGGGGWAKARDAQTARPRGVSVWGEGLWRGGAETRRKTRRNARTRERRARFTRSAGTCAEGAENTGDSPMNGVIAA